MDNEVLLAKLDERFAAIDKRFDEVDARFDVLFGAVADLQFKVNRLQRLEKRFDEFELRLNLVVESHTQANQVLRRQTRFIDHVHTAPWPA